MVHAGGADVIGPAVATHDPNAAPHQLVGHRQQVFGLLGVQLEQRGFQLGDADALRPDLRLGDLRGGEDGVHQPRIDLALEFQSQLRRQCQMLVGGQPEPQAEFGVVLKQRVRPGRAAPFGVLGPRRGGQVAAVNRRAAGGVRHDEPVAEQLRQQAHIRRLAAAGASAGELEQRLQELRAAHRGEIHPRTVVHREGLEEADAGPLPLQDRRFGSHVDGLDAALLQALRRADLDAQAATGAILDVHLQGVARLREATRIDRRGLEAFRGFFQPGLGVKLGADHPMRADEAAIAALDADVRLPHRHEGGDVALFPLRGAGGIGAVHGQHGNRQLVALPRHHHRRHFLHELGRLRRHDGRHFDGAVGLLWQFDRVKCRQGLVHRDIVFLHHVLALFAIGLLDRLLDLGDGLVFGQHAGDGEEAGLHDGVGAAAHAGFLRNLRGVNHIKLYPQVDDPLLQAARQMPPHLIRAMRAVEQEGRAGAGAGQHVDLLGEDELVAADEAGRADQIRRVDRVRPEAHMRHRLRTGFLRVVDEIALRVQWRGLADDLDAVLVRAHRAVRAQANEQGTDDLVRLDVEGFVIVQAAVRHVVVDADHEMILRGVFLQFVQHRLRHRRGEFLGRQAVTPADNARQSLTG